MQLPALSIQQPDLGATLARAALVKNAAMKNKLLQAKLDREAELSGLRSQIFAQPSQDERVNNALAEGGGPTNKAADILAQPGGFPTINNAMLLRYAGVDPEGASQIANVIGKMDERQRATVKRQNDITARLLLSVERVPPEQRQAAYAQALARAQQLGVPTANAPAQYDPMWARQTVAQAMTVEQLMNQVKPPANFERAPDGGVRPIKGGPADPAYLKEKSAAERKGAESPSRIREAEILVDRKVFPDFKTAYNATRTRVAMDPATIRSKALSWVASQKDRYGRPKYTTPEAQNAAMQAYQKWVAGDSDGALAALKALEPKKPGGKTESDRGILGSLWQSLVGGGEAEPAPKEPTKPEPAKPATNQQTVIQQAKDAIARGAPREAVARRLREMGLDPAALDR